MRVQNFTPQSYATIQVAGQKRKRYRQALSCHECRVRKIACDRGNPCSNCSKSSRPKPCTYEGLEDGRPNGGPQEPRSLDVTSDTTLLSMGQRMARIERIVKTLAEKVDSAGLESGTRPPSPAITDRTHDLESGLAEGLTKIVNQPAAHSEGLLATTEPGTVFYIGRTGWSMVNDDKSVFYKGGPRDPFSQQWAAYQELVKGFKGQWSRTILHCTSLTSSCNTSSNIESTLLGLIPDRQTCDVLFERYLLTFHSTHPLLNEEVFRSEVKDFWQQREHASKYWLGLYVSVLAMGFELPVVPLPPGEADKGGRLRAREMLNKAMSLVFTSSSSRKPHMACFQMLLLLTQAYSLDISWVDGNSPINGLLGLATRMAFAMGFHRDPTLARGISEDEIQLRRMIWSTFKKMDFEFCLQSGMPFLLREADSDIHASETVNACPHDYEALFTTALPIWSRVVQITHSNRAALPKQELVDLFTSMHELDESLRRMSQIRQEPASKPEQVKTMLLQAIIICTHQRLLGVLYSPFMHDPDLTLRMKARNIVLESSSVILAQQHLLHAGTDAGSHGDAMAHFHFATLHCNVYYALSNIVMLSKPVFVEDFRRASIAVEPQVRLASCFKSANIMSRTLPFSPFVVKTYIALNALIVGATRRLCLSSEPGKTFEDFEAPEARQVLEAMRVSMHESLDLSSAAIEKALQSDDPPAILCAPAQGSQPDQAQDQGCGAVSESETDLFPADDAYASAANSDNWCFGNDFFSDVDLSMPMPFWLSSGF